MILLCLVSKYDVRKMIVLYHIHESVPDWHAFHCPYCQMGELFRKCGFTSSSFGKSYHRRHAMGSLLCHREISYSVQLSAFFIVKQSLILYPHGSHLFSDLLIQGHGSHLVSGFSFICNILWLDFY